jgi:L-amino acid N-acyltransferase YncA
MDYNYCALESLVSGRLTEARQAATPEPAPPGPRATSNLPRRLGVTLIALGEWLRRGADPRPPAVVIRPAAPRDNAAIAAIWNREVLETAATTDTEPRDAAAQAAWLAAHGPTHPVIVTVQQDEVVAFGALSPYRTKPSYARTVEELRYVRNGWQGKGLGGLVLDRLIALAARTVTARSSRASPRPTRHRWPCTAPRLRPRRPRAPGSPSSTASFTTS